MMHLFFDKSYLKISPKGSKLYFFMDSSFVEYREERHRELDISIFPKLLIHANASADCFIPGFASYGGLLMPSLLDLQTNSIFLEELKQNLAVFLSEFRNCQITLFPSGIFPHLFEFNLNLFLSIGFKILWEETNFHFDLNKWNQKDMSKGNNKRLRKNERGGITFKIEDSNSLDEVYNLLNENRSHRNATLSKNLNELKEMFFSLPQRYSLFSVNKDGKMLASAITINVTDKVAYILFWGDDINYRDFSPTVYLAVNLIDHYRNLEYNFLDLSVCVNGTRGADDIGLLTFKRNLGATSSKKLTLYRSKQS
jgi:hypothetical protein